MKKKVVVLSSYFFNRRATWIKIGKMIMDKKLYKVTMVWSEPDYGYEFDDWCGEYTEFEASKEIEASSTEEAICKYAEMEGMKLPSDAINGGVFVDTYCKIIAEEIKET
jgi:hypothetical protein